jgi:hypothetical protein
MKKIVFFISLAIIMLFAIPTQSQAQGQYGIGINGGYSWLNGIIGAEVFANKLSLSVGYMPTSMPLSGESVSSISWAVTWYSKPWTDNSWYMSYGMAMSGYREEVSYTISSDFHESTILPLNILMAGWRFTGKTGNWNLKVGLGLGWRPEWTEFTGEITFGYVLPFN